MCRKLFMGLGLLAAGSFLIGGKTCVSYFKTGYQQAHAYVKGQVPIEFELERARQMARDLVPDIRKAKRTIAEEEVKIERMRSDIAQAEKNLESERLAILGLRNNIETGLASRQAGRPVSPAKLQEELNRRFTSYKAADSTLKSRKDILEQREASLDAVRQQYGSMTVQKEQLEAELAALETRHKLIETRKVDTRLSIDSSDLSRLRELMKDLNDRLSVEDKLLQDDGNVEKSVLLNPPAAPSNLGQQIDQYFGTTQPTGAAL